jgi:hypothetical protein
MNARSTRKTNLDLDSYIYTIYTRKLLRTVDKSVRVQKRSVSQKPQSVGVTSIVAIGRLSLS